MIKELQLRVVPEIAYEELRLLGYVSTQLHIDANSIKKVQIVKRSIDARQRNVVINLSIKVYINEYPQSESLVEHIKYQDVSGNTKIIVVGAGPAGLFAALRLIELGLCPIVLERGKDVDSRRKDMARIARENIVFSIGIKVLVLILASLGLANMWLAIFADVGVTVLATLNAMRTMKLT